MLFHHSYRMSVRRPLVSVVIPCYKQAHFLGEAIESVLAQTYAPVETLVVDDGSPDNASDVALSYPGVRCIRTPNSGVVSAARNVGIRETTGEYLVFLDADDRLLPHTVEVGVREMEAHPEYAMTAGRVHLMSYEGEWLRTTPERDLQADPMLAILIEHALIYPVASTFRRSALMDVGGWNESVRTLEDWELTLRLSLRHPIRLHNDVVGSYRRYAWSKSHNNARLLAAITRMLQGHRRHVKHNAIYDAARRYALIKLQVCYVEGLTEEIKDDLLARRWRAASRRAAIMARYAPRITARTVVAELRRQLQRR